MAVFDINEMTKPLGDKEMMIKAFNAAKAANPDGRISDKDVEMQLNILKLQAEDPSLMAAKSNTDGRVSDMDRMKMLQASMRDDVNKTMRSPDIVSVALQIARSQGDTSEDNINLIIRQLQSLVPSVTQTAEKETTPLISQGIQGLLEKLGAMTGQQSDPMMNRSVGFGRVK
tara:strand:+ start:180 stop:695 length:516 start_codon:yes stop_codon:yes gene_type:complete